MRIPKLRFKEFSGEWEEKRLGDIGVFFSGGTPKSDNKKYYGGDIPFIKSGEISKEKTEQFLTKLGLENSSAKMIKKGDLLFALYGATSGECAISKIEGAINQAILVIRSEENNEFLLNSFKYYKKQIINKFLQGGQGNLSAELIKMLNFKFPSLEEQEKISNFLSSVDKKIVITEEKLNLFKEYKKGMMQKIFKQEIKFKDSNGNEFPKWVEKPLGELGEFKNGVNKGKDDFGSGYPFINLLDIFGKKFIENNDNLALVNVSEKELNDFNLLKGDVLFVRSSVKPEGVGLTTIVTKDLENTVYSGFIIRFRENANKLYLEYKKNCFYDEEFRKALLNKSTISANTNINQDNLKILKIKLPCLEEQKKIGSFLSSIDNKIENLSNELENLKDFKKGLLQKMFV